MPSLHGPTAQLPEHDTIVAPSRTRPICTRDPDYYREDGDCILLVGQVLFKVHRFLLTRDSSRFRNILKSRLPDGSLIRGGSDSSPIILVDDIVEFRALCCALYAPAHEIGAQYDPKRVDIPKIVSLVRIYDKYEFSGANKWTIDILETHLNPQSTCTFTDSCSADDLAFVLERSVDGQAKRMEEFIVSRWLCRIKKGELDTAHALNVAERLDLRNFQGMLYHLQVARLSPRAQSAYTPNTSTVFNVREELSKSSFTLDQQIKLINGICSLTLSWFDILKSMTPSNNHHRIGIYIRTNNCKEWELSVKKSISSIDFTLDCLGNIDRMLEALDKFGPSCAYCQAGAKDQLKDAKTRIEASLPDHFLGRIECRVYSGDFFA
ncbi:hypothetical protein AX16_004605 [Volvariella volvacea WC 439]|nr:hypothetical protein AX16_004605 [Volvariella volvacea WC 439]